MSFTKDQIRDYAIKLGEKGAPPEKIRAFVAAASKDMVDDRPVEVAQPTQPADVAPPRLGAEGGMLAGQIPGRAIPGTATALRLLPAVVPGGFAGSAAAGLGEKAAQFVEGRNDPRALGQATAMGAIPFGKLAKLGPIVGNGIAAATAGAANYGVNKLADAVYGKDGTSAEEQATLVTAITAAMPIVGRLLGKATGNVSPEEMARVKDLMDNKSTQVAREQIRKAREYELVTPSGERRRLKIDPTVPAVRNDGDLITKMVAGKTAMGQVVAKENVPVFQGMAQQDIGLPQTGGGISRAEYKAAYEPFYAPYNKIKQIRSQAIDQLKKLEDEVLGRADGLSSAQAARRAELEADPEFQRMAKPLRIQAAADVEGLKKARGDANRAMKRYTGSKGQDTEALETYKANREIAEALEVKIEDAARLSDDPGLLEDLGKARAGIARLHDYGDAIGSDGILDPQVLRMKNKAGVPLSGNAKTIAEFALNARNNAVQLSRIGDPNANAASGLAAGHAALTNPQAGVVSAGVPYLRDFARKRLLSESKQNALLAPSGARTSADPRVTEIITRLAAILAAQQGRE